MKKMNLFMFFVVLFLFVLFSCTKKSPTQPQDPTATYTSTTGPSATMTATAVDTSTATASPTCTDTATEMITSTATADDTASPTSTNTATATVDETASSTSTNTATVTQTSTPEPPASTCSFGVSTNGNYSGGVGGSSLRLSRFSTGTAITLSKIAYFVQADGAISGIQQAAIYSNSASNTPENLITSTSSSAIAGIGWNTVTITPTLLNPGEYWLAVYLNVAGASYNITGNSNVLGGWYGGSAWADPWSGGASNGAYGYSIRGICE